MGVIRVMPPELSNRIAAGEVVERPSSVVKELVENSIDAGATLITVTVEKAGTRLISVLDNGCGMDEDDAKLCFEQHGTSKLFDGDDISGITTMGFRGEAIPSIAAVAAVTIRTRTAEGRGIEVKSENGRISTAPCGVAKGTCVEVRDLFHNVPARKKFLRSPATEEGHIEECLMALAIGNCDVGFRLVSDGRTVFNCAAHSPLDARVREFFGRNYVANMRELDCNDGDIKVVGFVAAPGFTRPSRKEQRVYLNGRPVDAQPVWRGIRDGYGTIQMESGKYPPALVFLEMPPEEFDINVHPAKREVRFRNDNRVARAVALAVTRAITGGQAAVGRDQTGSPDGRTSQPDGLFGDVGLEQIMAAAKVFYKAPQGTTPDLGLDRKSEAPVEPVVPVGDETSAPFASRNTPEAPAFSGQWPENVIGILDRTYLLCSCGSDLVVVDQHAAHERVMFERIMDKMSRGAAGSQQLLLGQVVTLPFSKLELLCRNQKMFEDLGFSFERMGRDSVMVNALPDNFSGMKCTLEEFFDDFLQELVDNPEQGGLVRPELAARAACRAAVKAHDELTLEQARILLGELRACRQGTLCPHGRPTMVVIGRRELEKRFGRR
ncbi:MAG: DNA mismatch repair endonuclease MutL [Victivallaceae bacterium]|nr:DNA mismatch repair endonuclease MutL [Victivallaceae bacterium]